MAVGRITGPLLASNLRRDGVNLAVETDLLYIDVINGRIGVRRDNPQFELDVNGTINADKIIVNTATIGLVTIESSTSSSTLSTIFGPFSISPSGDDDVFINSDLLVDGDVFASGNFFAEGNIKLGNETGTDIISLLGEIDTDILPYISSGTYVTTETEFGTVTNFITNTEIISDYSIGNTSSYWQNAYLQNIFTRQIDTVGTETDVQFFPDIPALERTLNKSVTINGDIRVYGGNPLGTFPIVNNILYVNENGSDENDGRAMDASRACRTITGAVRSPYYKEGTIIRVAPGIYYEDNPIPLKKYSSVIGDSLRGSFIFPLDNATDLFHVNSGVYITGMTMRDLRRGEVIRYAPGGAGTYTTGAYCVAFPPRLDNPIDLFHSPYIQNCTNQSGPWLYDGTMFVPNQTVQIPEVIATATYSSGTTTLLVTVLPEITAQQLEIGMSVNGKGILIDDDLPVATVESIENINLEFRNAKTLLLENKDFIAGDLVAWVNTSFPALVYDQEKFLRDARSVVDALVYDAILGGQEKTVEAGRSYYQGNVQILGNETTATIAAFNRIKDLAPDVLNNISLTPSIGNPYVQFIDVELIGADAALPNINRLIDLLVDIIKNNTGYGNAAALLNANRGFMQAETVAFVNETYVGQPIPSFVYDRSKRFNDASLIIDAVANDLLYGGNEQTRLVAFDFNNGSNVISSDEIAEAIAGFSYLAMIVRDVILQQEFNDGYQTTVTQVTGLATGTNASIEIITRNISIINSVLKDGPGAAPAEVPNTVTSSTIAGVVNSYNLLMANKEFLQHEVVGYTDVTFTNLDFEYNAVKCARDTGLILDGLVLDLVHGGSSQSTFAGLQYWNQTNSAIPGEETTTTNAFIYAKAISQSIIQNTPISPLQDSSTQTYITTGSTIDVSFGLGDKFDTIINILINGTSGVTDQIIPNGEIVDAEEVFAAIELLELNRQFITDEVIAWVEANKGSEFSYDDVKCRRDIGYILDCVAFDLLRGGNRQSIQAGVYYYGYNSTSTVLVNEVPQTIAAYRFMKSLIEKVVQRINVTKTYSSSTQNTDLLGATNNEAFAIGINIDLIRDIIRKGPSVAPPQVPITLAASTNTNVLRAEAILNVNREFIVNEVVEFVNKTFIQPFVFKYNEEKCFRDVGLIVDAVATDIIRRANVNSLEAGLAYWDGAVSVIEGQLKETSGAIQYTKSLALKIIANNPVTAFYQIATATSTLTTATIVQQVINSQLPGGEIARDLVDSNFNAITTILDKGPAFSPFSTESTITQFMVTLSTSTVASVVNDIMYFGYTTVYPEEDRKIPGEWGPNGFADRRIDPNGSGGGALVDGNAPSERSPIQSFVFDAFTQITQGGRGIHIINRGYAQLVSVFTIFCNIAVECDNGGIASVTNSNANFGDLCLVAKGYGPREFGGTIYNPGFVSYVPATNTFEVNEFFPQGYFPTSQQICVFVPDPDNRPHISLVMEVIPPDEYVNYDGETVPYVNEQGFPGFVTAIANTGSLTTGSYTISGIDVTGISIGQNLFIRDQFGYEADDNGDGVQYLETGTTVVDIGFKTIYLSNPIQQGGGQFNNDRYFDIYACGNAYYNVLTSIPAVSPYPTGQSKILGQETETIDAIKYFKSIAAKVVNNELITNVFNTRTEQVIDTTYQGGNNAVPLMNSNIDIITDVILSGPQAAPQSRTTGPQVEFKNNAITLLELNRKFLKDEVTAYVDIIYGGFVYDDIKCSRDTGLIVDSIAFDLLYDSTSQSTFAGLQYWNQGEYIGNVVNEITTITAAINYVKSLAMTIANTAGGSSPELIVGQRFDDIITILQNGTDGVTDIIVPNGTATTNVNYIAAVEALQTNKESIKSQTISWITVNHPDFIYDQETYQSDVGYIIDGVSFDLTHGGNRQSIMSGVYYYSYNSTSTAIVNEIPQTTAAYNFIKAIISDIITGTPISPQYQNNVSQVTDLEPATFAEVSSLQSKINLINNIINNGPSVADEKEPIGLISNTSTSIVNAFNLLLANRDFIRAETIAYINQEFVSDFKYNRQKCRRDVGLIIDALKADVDSGGNFRSVEAAKTYYTRDGTYHIVTLEDNVRNQLLFIDGTTVNFYQRSYMSASGYLFEYVGAGTQYGALPQVGRVDPKQEKEVVQLNNGKVFFTSTDQNGDFRIGPTLVISQATGVLSGRTFEKSLFAQMTPFILAVESGGSE
jgi:hypothetical protein